MKELVIAARKDIDAKLKLLKSFEPLIKKCFKLYIKDFNLYDEAMQEGYIAILKCIDLFDTDSPYEFPGYVKISVIRRLRHLSQKISQKITLSLDEEIDEDGGTLHDLLKSDMDIEALEIRRYETKALYMALNNLTDKQRDIIDSIYFKNLSMKDICKAKRCHYMAIVQMKNRALEALKRELKDA